MSKSGAMATALKFLIIVGHDLDVFGSLVVFVFSCPLQEAKIVKQIKKKIFLAAIVFSLIGGNINLRLTQNGWKDGDETKFVAHKIKIFVKLT